MLDQSTGIQFFNRYFMQKQWKSFVLASGLSLFASNVFAAVWGNQSTQGDDTGFLRDIVRAQLNPSSQKWQNQYNGETHFWQVHKSVQRPVGTQTERWVVFSRMPTTRNALKNQVFGFARLTQEGTGWRLKQMYESLHQPNAQSTGAVKIEFRMIGPKTFITLDNPHQINELTDNTRYLFDPFSGKSAGNMTLGSRGNWGNNNFLDCQTKTAAFIKQANNLPNVELGQECNAQGANKTQQKLVYVWQKTQYVLQKNNTVTAPKNTPGNSTPKPAAQAKAAPAQTTTARPSPKGLMDSIPTVTADETVHPQNYSAPLKKQSIPAGAAG